MSAHASVRLGLVGHPVSHSASPSMFRAAFHALGIDGSYEARDIPPPDLAAGVRRIVREGWAGFNVTVPHKAAVMGLLDAVDPEARQARAVNTVVARGGRLEGHNTDVSGFVASLPEVGAPTVAGAEVLVLGAGGAARAAVLGLLRLGAGRIVVANRGPAAAEDLVASLGGQGHGGRLEAVPLDAVPSLPGLAAVSLCVQATRLGLKGSDPLPIDPSVLSPSCFVCDLVYGPGGTPLVRTASALGMAAADGREMLLRQAAEAFRLWLGLPPPVDAMRQGMEGFLGGRRG